MGVRRAGAVPELGDARAAVRAPSHSSRLIEASARAANARPAIGVSTGTQIPAANGLTTAQMSDPASFGGYDFGRNGVWAMPAGATHPVLRWQVELQ